MDPSKDTQNSEDKKDTPTADAWCQKCNIRLNIPFDRFTDEEYINWIKAILCLQHTKEGLEKFVDTLSKEIYDNAICFISPALNCTQRKSEDFTKHADKCKTCVRLKTRITVECCMKKGPTWKNTTLKEMMASPNNVAKLFMQPQCSNYTNPEQGDITALLSFMENSNIAKPDKPDAINELRECRNKVMHSGTMRIEAKRLTAIKDTCVALLQQLPKKYTECQNAIDLLEQIVGNPIRIDFIEKENHVLNLHSKHVKSDLEGYRKDINSSECTPEEIEEKKEIVKQIKESQIELKVSYEWYGCDINTFSDLDSMANKLSDLDSLANEILNEAEKKKTDIMVEEALIAKKKKKSKLQDKLNAQEKELEKERTQSNDLEIKIKEQLARQNVIDEQMEEVKSAKKTDVESSSDFVE